MNQTKASSQEVPKKTHDLKIFERALSKHRKEKEMKKKSTLRLQAVMLVFYPNTESQFVDFRISSLLEKYSHLHTQLVFVDI